jgi:hypothetical protein
MNKTPVRTRIVSWKYLREEEKYAFGFIFISIILLLWWLFLDNGLQQRVDWFSLSVGLLGSIPILLIWFNQLKKRWIDSLPTFLTVTLKYKTQKLAVVENVYIENGSDVRSQAQTLLSGVVKGSRVNDLEQFLRPDCIERKQIFIDKNEKINSGQPFEFIEVSMFVTEEPKEVECYNTIDWAEKGQSAESQVFIEPGKYWRWCPLCEEVEYKNKFILVECEESSPK